MSKNENLPRQMKTSQSITNLQAAKSKQSSGMSTIMKTPTSTNPLTTIEVDMISQHSYNGPGTTRNPPLQNVTHKYINPTNKLSHSNTEMALSKIAPTTTSSLCLGSPVPSMAPSQ